MPAGCILGCVCRLSEKENYYKSAGLGGDSHMYISDKRVTAATLAACGICDPVWNRACICYAEECGMRMGRSAM